MGARARMTRRAALERNMATGDDIYGQPLPPDWQPVGLVPCWAWENLERQITDQQGEVVIEDVRALFSPAADVRTNDRVMQITNRLGEVLWPGPFQVDTVIPRVGHLEVSLRRIS